MNTVGLFYDLNVPFLEEIGKNFIEDLRTSFDSVECSVVTCPDLTEKPFHLNTKGICGNVIIADVGGVSNLVPYPKLNKTYDIAEIVKMYDRPETFVCGAGAGPFHRIKSNCEMVPLVKFKYNEAISNQTLLALIRNEENFTFKSDLTEFGILGQFHCCEGLQGEVLKVNLSRRRKEGSVLTFLQNSLKKHYSDRHSPVYISGIILMETGTAKIHVMSDFVDEPLDSDAKVNDWLRFFHVQAPFVGFAVLASHDPLNLGLRLEHCHGFTLDRSVAGHFHYDTTADTVKYTAYFVVGTKVLRQDAP